MEIYGEYLQLARLAISGRHDDIEMLLRRAMRRSKDDRPEFQEQLKQLVSQFVSDSTTVRRRASFNRKSDAPASGSAFLDIKNEDFSMDPVWSRDIELTLSNVIAERQKIKELQEARIEPTSSLLFVGPPGVGKSLAAKWLARELNRNLLTLDLASLMSSYLGKTASNLRAVINEAANSDSILFLDEFDSIGKRRDDQGDVGELKRLVNVLLQALDNWPSNGLLIAATNHSELLDKAIWRRFDHIVKFDNPSQHEISLFVVALFSKSGIKVKADIINLIAIALEGSSFADVELWVTRAIRTSIVNDLEIGDSLLTGLGSYLSSQSKDERVNAALSLIRSGVSQRKASEVVGLSRDTVRKYLNSNK